MLDNQGYQNNMMGQQFIEGTPVYDVNGDKVGDVSEHGVQGGALVIHKGLFFPKDLYIPLSAIRGSDANGVYLSLTKDDIKNQNWTEPPAEDATMATPTYGTPVNATAEPVTPVEPVAPVAPAQPVAPRNAAPIADDVANARDIRVPVREEELIADKERRQVGDVRVHREVEEQPETIAAPVTHEEVIVERTPGTNAPVGEDAFTDKDIDVPVMGESLNVSKQARNTEDVHLRKQRVTEQERASGNVRRERVDIEGNPDDVIRTEGNLRNPPNNPQP